MAASVASVESPLPRSVGRYTLFDKIGRGGMADIFLARAQTDLGISRLVVVKQILPHLADSSEFSSLLITEAKLAARLDHANVVQVHDLGRADGFLYIAMQYVEGFDLAELLRRCTRTKTPLPVQYALLVIIEAVRGLDYAHRKTTEEGAPLGIVHRDVSPSNILISFEGEIKLCDFGIAHANDVVNSAAFSEDVIKGKAGYMSPEHARGEPLDARADVFAIGIVMWELLAGRRLYRASPDGSVTLLDQAKAAKVLDLPARGLPLEERLFGIVYRALAVDRNERYPSTQALLLDLERYVADSKLIASPIRFGEWLLDRFGDELIQQRRERERALHTLGTSPSSAPGKVASEPPVPVLPVVPETPTLHMPSRLGSRPTYGSLLTRSMPEAPPPARPSQPEVPFARFVAAESSTPSGMWIAVAAVAVAGAAAYFFAAR